MNDFDGSLDHEAWKNKGDELIDLERYEEALAAFESALEIKPDDHDAWNGKGRALRNLDRDEEALAAYDKSLEIKPDFHKAWNGKGNALRKLDKYEEALATYDKALEIKPDYHKAWNGKGNALIDLDKYEEALAAYDKSLEIKPDYHKAWNGKGIALRKLDKYEEALAAYDKSLEIKPDYHNAWNGKGIALRKLDKYEEALAAYDKSLEIKPDFHYAWNGKGNALIDLGRYEEALAAYDKSLEIKPDYHNAWSGKGIALKVLDRYQEALATFDRAIQIKPDQHEPWCNKGRMLNVLRRYEEGLETSEQALKFKSDCHLCWNDKGNALYFLGNYEEAFEAYKNAVNAKPDYAKAWYNLAKAFDRLRRYKDIDAEYEETVLRDRNPKANFFRGIVLNKLGRYQKALECLNEAEKLTETPDWEIWQHRGWAIYELHGYDAAIEHWKQALPLFAALQWNPTLQQLEPDTAYRQKGRGILYWQMAKASDRQNKQRDAKSSYKLALELLTEKDFPEQHLEVLQELIPLYRKLGNIREAEALTRNGIDLLGKLVQQTASKAKKTELSQKFASFNQLRVDEIAFSPYSRQKTIALELAEEHKNLCLAWMERGFVESSSSNFSSPKYPEIQTLLDSQTAAIYWHLSPAAITVFLLRNSKPPQVIRKGQPLSLLRRDVGELLPAAKPKPAAYLAASEQLQQFQDWMERWRESYGVHSKEQKQQPSNNSQWRDGMEAELEKLREILESDRLLPLLADVQRLILIPHRDLHLLPLHYLFGDRFTISYLPSAKVGLEMADSTPQTTPESLLSIENTAQDLRYAPVESAFIRKQFSTRSLAGEDATMEKLKTQLETPTEIFHFTGHSYHDSDRPLESELVLAKGSLKLEHLFGLEKVAINLLVYLSSCETGMTGTEGLIDEFVGLASGFLAKGAKYVISTLWRVPEISTAMLTIRFYQLYKEGKTPVIALKEAQNWLRGATYEKLIELYNQLAAELEADAPACAEALEAAADAAENDVNIKKKDFCPYAHPYYWAGFIVTGKV